MDNMSEKKKVLFICNRNSARSQMAEAALRNFYGDQYSVHSCGTNPSEVNLYAIKVMKDMGIDISHQRAKSIDEFLGKKFDYVITICDQAKESCPYFPGAKNYIHKGFTDPAQFNGDDEEILDIFRKVRDEILGWVRKTFKSLE